MKKYSLKEIAQWQQDSLVSASTIKLPSLQRGFVWKPNQIEALWDSIFRGYPIGAILMSIDEHKNRFLLDGQQRCTSIALGHINPYSDNKNFFLSLKDYKPSIWIDLAPEKNTEGQKFVFRCLTKSHPWGYQLRDNSAALSMSNRRNALAFFNPSTESYLDLTSKDISPWDVYFPIPLSFVLEININETTNFELFKNELIQKALALKIKTQHSNNEFVDYTLLNRGDFDENLKNIYIGYCNYKNLSLPEIAVNASLLKEDDSDNNESQDPSLFVRLNSAGTRISGEELIYSVYKAKFPEIKDLVENIGASYIAPSKIISLFSRLIISEQSNYSNFQKDLSIQNFRKKITEVDFQKKLKNYIGNEKESNAKKLVDSALAVLSKGQSDFPAVLLKQLMISNFDLLFVLITYLNKHDSKAFNNEERNEIASSYVWILWFSKDSKNAVIKLYDFLFSKTENHTWSAATKKLITANLVLPVINPELIKNQLTEIVIKNKKQYNDFNATRNMFLPEIKEQLFYDDQNEFIFNENWSLLIEKIYNNKSMLIYAQKEYMNTKFKEFNQFENLDDTNRPWDWDHIYPDSWVYRKEGINILVRKWVNCIGNFRALSYDDNRSENNHLSPKERFENDSKKSESFISQDNLAQWNAMDQKFGRIKENDQDKTKIFLDAVICRMLDIYQEWLFNYYQS